MTQAALSEKISINYIEFNVKDIARTKAFYHHLGWTFTDYGKQYCEFDSGQLKGGFYQTHEHINAQGGALIILYSQNLEYTLTTIQQAGGTITQNIFDFPGGRRFHFKDLDGYELAIWSNQ